MKAKIEEIQKVMASPGSHSELCKCTMCMVSKLPPDIIKAHEQGLLATMVDRKNPDNPDKPLMKSTKAHAILKAGSKVNMLIETGIDEDTLPDGLADLHLSEPKELTVCAQWKHRDEEPAISGRDASVFGGLGVLLIPPDIKVVDIPQLDARSVPRAFLKRYGAELVALQETLEIEPVEHEELENLYLVQYNFEQEYVEEYVLKMMGGGGIFVETHPFPQIFTPLAAECGGAIILGIDNGKGEFNFTSFRIPFGYTLKIAPNVIHGDSFFVGPYAIALTETELADSVLIRQDTVTRDIQKVRQSPSLRLPILLEYHLARTINHQMMIDKIRAEGPEGKDLSFYRALPFDVLSEVYELSAVSRFAFHERGRLPQVYNYSLYLNSRSSKVEELPDKETTLISPPSGSDLSSSPYLSREDASRTPSPSDAMKIEDWKKAKQDSSSSSPHHRYGLFDGHSKEGPSLDDMSSPTKNPFD